MQYNGIHHLVLNAWDQQGHLFQTSAYVNQIDAAVPLCGAPSRGFNLCAPSNGTYWPEDGIQVVAAGAPNIQSYTAKLDSGPANTYYVNRNLIGLWGLSPADNKTHALNFVAKDSSGHTYPQSVSFKLFWPGYARGKNACDPGVFINSPADQQDVTSPFTLDAAVEYNTHVITAMKAYVDNSGVAMSSGPTIRAQVPASHGTHLLTVQAWDTTGTLYKTQFTINVQ